MTRLLIAAAILAAVLAAVQARPRAYSIGQKDQVTRGLVAYWSMRNSGTTVFDEWGTNNGSASNGVTFATTYGVVGFGASADGVNDYIRIEDADALSPANTMTISVWIKPSSIPGEGTAYNIFTKYNTTAGVRGYAFQVYHGGDAPIRLRVLLSLDGTTIAGFFTGNIDALSAQTWLHVAVTVNTADLNPKIYVNGATVSGSWETGAMPAAMVNNSVSVLIGGRFVTGTPAEYFVGSIDEARLYNVVLTADEIRRLYRMGRLPLDNR